MLSEAFNQPEVFPLGHDILDVETKGIWLWIVPEKYTVSKRLTLGLPFTSDSKQVFVQNHKYRNVFRLHVHFHANQTHFNIKGFALVLQQRYCKVAQKWPFKCFLMDII